MIQRLHKIILCVFISFCLIFSSCNSNNTNTKTVSENKSTSAANQISKDLEFLTSDICEGRKYGTAGNKKASEYIAGRFKDISLEPLESNYSLLYKAKTSIIKKINLEIFDGEKSVHILNYGKDYIELQLDNTELALPLCEKPIDKDCAILTDDPQKATEYTKNNNVKLILLQNKSKYTRGAFFHRPNCIPEIGVSATAFEKLQKNIGKTVHFSVEINDQETNLENVAGIIKGEDQSSTLLVTAHFDHLGSIDTPYSTNYTIWRGALDNASGVSALLEVAGKLKNIYAKQKPPYDIIICALNGEEVINESITGSNFFAKYINEKYQSVFDINLDCLGNKDSSTLYLSSNSSNASKEITQKLLTFFKEQNIGVDLSKAEFASDHKNFEHAVCLTTVPDFSKINIHSLEDTSDKIDPAFICKIADKLSSCITSIIGTINISKTQEANHQNSDKDNHIQTGTATPLLSVSDFEKQFNCKLDFLKSTEAHVEIISRIDLFNEQKKADNKPAKITTNNLSDIRIITFYLDSRAIRFSTYKLKNPKEMDFYKLEEKMNGFDKVSEAQSVKLGNNNYHIFSQENGKIVFLTNEFENENLLIRVEISSGTFSITNTPEQYQEFFEKSVTEEFIDGMVKLLQEKG